MGFLVAVLVVLLVLKVGYFLFLRPGGKLVYQDAGVRSRLFVDGKLGLAGKPDQIWEKSGGLVVVEFKSGRVRFFQPYFGDKIQLYVYCWVVEACFGMVVKYGVLKYANRSFYVRWNQRARGVLVSVLGDFRAARFERIREEWKCRNCGQRDVC